MAKCKDCLHYEACLTFSKIINAARDVEKGCEHFKDRTKYEEVVRYKNCKHYYYSVYAMRCICDFDNKEWDKDDFCSYGERKPEPVPCKECKHLMFSDCYGECGKGHKGIVRPDDSCEHGERREGE